MSAIGSSENFTDRWRKPNIFNIFSCYADFARVGGPQQVSLADECLQYSTIIHEFMHVIGFIHEHQRGDRDTYVNIIWENIIPGRPINKL